MTIKHLVPGLALAALAGGVQANTILNESFANVAGLAGAGWAQVNASTAPLGNAWFQGNAGIFAAASGPASAYVAANFLSTGSANGAVSNWLMTPALMLDGTSVVSFLVRAAGEDFLDTVEVRLSTSGASTNTADFSTLLGTYSSSTDQGWVPLSYALSSLGAPTMGRIAFRYVVGDVSIAGNYVGIDDVTITAIPEPATALIMGLGVAGLMLRRRLSV